jgi:hypothetical protein
MDMAIAGFVAAGMTAIAGEVARQSLTTSAARARARRAGGATVYRVTLAGRFVFDAAIVIMAGLAALVVYHGEDWRIAALLGGFVMLCVFAYPGAIVVDATGVRTRRWYGRPVRIAWPEVAELTQQDRVGQTTLVSYSGRSIVHTSLHADGAGFRREVTARARLTPRIVPR